MSALRDGGERRLQFGVAPGGPGVASTAHVTGFSRGGCRGRASTAIVRFDPEARRLLTTSGRIYDLAGRLGFNGDAFAVWGNWKHRNGVLVERDVTLEVDQQMADAGTPPGK